MDRQATKVQSIATAQMAKYRCHKVVSAAKIHTVAVGMPKTPTEGVKLYFSDGTYRGVSSEYVRKHNPRAGGYFVVYKDGYESFSPAETFESGYTLIDSSSV